MAARLETRLERQARDSTRAPKTGTRILHARLLINLRKIFGVLERTSAWQLVSPLSDLSAQLQVAGWANMNSAPFAESRDEQENRKNRGRMA